MVEVEILNSNRCTLQEHDQLRTKMKISVISDLLKSMGGIFRLNNPQISQISEHPLCKALHSLKGWCSGILLQVIFKCTKKVLLRECKRHTAHHVESAHSATLSPDGVEGWGYFHPVPTGRGYPYPVPMGSTPSSSDREGYLPPVPNGGYPI